MQIYQATLEDLDVLVQLFNQYRIFYRQPSDIESCRKFLSDRMSRNEAILFIARDEEKKSAGFTLLYPMFSSVRMARVFVLNDLYVHKDFRRKGIGAMLLQQACAYGRQCGAVGLQLETEESNTTAQALYEKEGWVKEEDEYHYNYTL